MSDNIFLRVSAGELVWDIGGTPVNMGPTTGGIIFKDEQSTVDIMQDGYGDAPIDSITKGSAVSLEMTMSNMTSDRIAVIHGITQTTGPIYTANNNCGVSLRGLAKKVTIKPIVNLAVSTTTSEWLTVFKCVPVKAFEFAFNDEDQRLWKVIFKVFPDDTTGNVGRMWALGE